MIDEFGHRQIVIFVPQLSSEGPQVVFRVTQLDKILSNLDRNIPKLGSTILKYDKIYLIFKFI